MGASFSNDLNVPDPSNSTTTPLLAFEVFTGEFREVVNYSSVTVSCKSDVGSIFSGIFLEWSTDGVSADITPQRFTFDPVATSLDGFTVHATVRARFVRVIYQNSFTDQSFFTLTTLLRKGTPAGTVRSIDPTNTFLTNIDVQTVQGILSMVGRANPEQIMLPVADDANIADFPGADGPFVFTSPRPINANFIGRRLTTATLIPTLLTNFDERRVTLSIVNDVLRGNLFIRLGDGSGLSTTSWDYVIPPGGTWQDPGQFGSVYSGEVWGVWDEVYIQSVGVQEGHARYTGVSFGG